MELWEIKRVSDILINVNWGNDRILKYKLNQKQGFTSV